MGQAIGYVRVPAEMFSDQDDAQAQRLRITVWARETGHTLATILEETGPPANGMGPALEQAISQLKAGDVLVLDKVSVAATSLSDWASLYNALNQAGVAVASVSDGFDTLPGSPGGALVARALQALSDLPSQATRAVPTHIMAKDAEDKVEHPKSRYLGVYTEAGRLTESDKDEQAIELWRTYLENAQGENAGCGWNCLGDIYVRQRRIQEAVTSFTRAAQAFEQDGSPDRALAILGKVRRNAPDHNDVFIHQARLSAQLERMGDALAAYLAYARTQVDAGNYPQALDTFGKIRILNPLDPQFRLGIATEMGALGFHEEAVKEIICAAELLIQHNHHQSAQMELSRIQGSSNKDIDRLLAIIDQAENNPIDDRQPVLVGTDEPDFLTPAPDIYHPAQFRL